MPAPQAFMGYTGPLGRPLGPPLSDCNIVLCGIWPGQDYAEIEQRLLNPLGATHQSSIGPSTTHIVVLEGPGFYEGPRKHKVDQAKASGRPLVTLQWLEECLLRSARIPEENFKPRLALPLSTILRAELLPVALVRDAPSIDKLVVVDEGVPENLFGFEVYIDEDRVVYDVLLRRVDVLQSWNTYVRLQLLRRIVTGEFTVWSRHGRVGSTGSWSYSPRYLEPQPALNIFRNQFQAWTGLDWSDRHSYSITGKHVLVERIYYDPDYEDFDAVAPGVTKAEDFPVAAKELTELIFKQQYVTGATDRYRVTDGTFPLGQLNHIAFEQGSRILGYIRRVLEDNTLATSMYQATPDAVVTELANLYYTLVPVNSEQSPLQNLANLTEVAAEERELGAMRREMEARHRRRLERENVAMQELRLNFESLGLEVMTPLDAGSQEFEELKALLRSTRGPTHAFAYQVSQIFRVQIRGEGDKINRTYGLPQNRRLLWHGSRCVNIRGILTQGLRIAPPEALVSGHMFDKGIYLAEA